MSPLEGTEDPGSPDRGAVPAVLARVGWSVVLPLAAALALGLGVLQLLGLLVRPLALLVVAVTLAEALDPGVDWLEERIHQRGIAIAVVYLGLAAVLGGLGWLIAPPVIGQTQELVRQAPSMIDQVQSRLSELGVPMGQGVGSIPSGLTSRMGQWVIDVPTMVFTGLVDVLVVIFLSVYWLLATRSMMGFTLSLFPAAKRDRARDVLHHMGHSMGGYVRGAVINAAIMGVLAWIGLRILGVPYSVALGALTMVGEIIPILGPVLVGIVVTGVALIQSFTLALAALFLYTALEQVEGHILTPNIMRSQTDLPQTLVLFAIVAGVGTGGVLGLLVSIPLAAVFRVLAVEVLAPAERRAVNGGGKGGDSTAAGEEGPDADAAA